MQLVDLESRYFDDFRFERFSLADNYFRSGDLGYQFEASNISIQISDSFSKCGFDRAANALQLLPEYAQDENVLLHELIHIYERIYDESIPDLRELLTLQLYKKLSAKHPDIDRYIDNFTARSRFLDIAKEGGVHGVLFALKALDIDDRKGWKPGTTFGYIEYKPAG